MCGSRGLNPPASDVLSLVGGLVRRSSTHQLELVVVELHLTTLQPVGMIKGLMLNQRIEINKKTDLTLRKAGYQDLRNFYCYWK